MRRFKNKWFRGAWFAGDDWWFRCGANGWGIGKVPLAYRLNRPRPVLTSLSWGGVFVILRPIK